PIACSACLSLERPKCRLFARVISRLLITFIPIKIQEDKMFGTEYMVIAIAERSPNLDHARPSARKPRPSLRVANVVTTGRDLLELTKTASARRINGSQRSWFQTRRCSALRVGNASEIMHQRLGNASEIMHQR